MTRYTRGATITATVVVAAVLLAGCVPTRDLRTVDNAPSIQDLGEVHALAVDPQSGRLYVAAHEGIWVAERSQSEWQPPERIADQDLIALAVGDDGTMMATADSDAESALLTSEDGGATWAPIDGELIDADLLRIGDGRVYAYDDADRALMSSDDGGRSWELRNTVDLRDFAVDRGDADRVWLLGGDGLQQSTDGGANISRVRDTPQLARIAWAGEESHEALVALAANRGRIWTRDGDDSAWRAKGRISRSATALAHYGGAEPYTAVVDERGVVVSEDFGYSWTALVPAPD